MNIKPYIPADNEIFHVHTRRCGHAGTEADEEYVKRAVELQAKRIVFTDHAPFPGDPFENRMKYDELTEYVSSIKRLKDQYDGEIQVVCGLEAEYVPEYEDYYRDLLDNKGVEILVMGQHFCGISKGRYSFDEKQGEDEYKGLCEAMIKGAETGLFSVIAHPDRAFRRCKAFSKEHENSIIEVINAAKAKGLYVEKNYRSTQRKNQYRPELWGLVPDDMKVLYGIDAHSVEEMTEGYLYWKEKKGEQ